MSVCLSNFRLESKIAICVCVCVSVCLSNFRLASEILYITANLCNTPAMCLFVCQFVCLHAGHNYMYCVYIAVAINHPEMGKLMLLWLWSNDTAEAGTPINDTITVHIH